jgi:hypothetical protein
MGHGVAFSKEKLPNFGHTSRAFNTRYLQTTGIVAPAVPSNPLDPGRRMDGFEKNRTATTTRRDDRS